MNDIVKVKKIRDSLTYHRRPEETFAVRFLPHGDRLFGDVQDLVNHHSHTAVAVVENDDLDRIGLVVVGTAGLQHVSERHEAEDAVDDGESGGFGRYERTGLGQDGDDRGLAQVGAFTAHVGAGDDGDEIGGIVEVEIVGNEAPGFLFGEALDDGMAAGEYTHLAAHLAGTRERGALVAVFGGDLGERGGDVEFGDGGGGGADALRV